MRRSMPLERLADSTPSPVWQLRTAFTRVLPKK
jgi:hypothetical protein